MVGVVMQQNICPFASKTDVFATAGSGTYTVPAGAHWLVITVDGPGGGASWFNGTGSMGGGGGGGGRGVKNKFAVNGGDTINWTVGTHGTRGTTSGSNGNTGTASSVSGGTGTLAGITITGNSGVGGTTGGGGAGGTATGGDTNTTGGAGSNTANSLQGAAGGGTGDGQNANLTGTNVPIAPTINGSGGGACNTNTAGLNTDGMDGKITFAATAS